MGRFNRAQMSKAIWSAIAELREECHLDCAGRSMSQRIIRVGNFQRREKRLLDYLNRPQGELPQDLRELVQRHIVDKKSPLVDTSDSERPTDSTPNSPH